MICDGEEGPITVGSSARVDDGSEAVAAQASALLDHGSICPNSTNKLHALETAERSSSCSGGSLAAATPRRPNSTPGSSSGRRVGTEPRSLRPKSGVVTSGCGNNNRGINVRPRGVLYDRSINSCARHLRALSDSEKKKIEKGHHQRDSAKSTSIISLTTISTPSTFTTGTGLGLGLEFLAFRDKYTEVVVREAKARILLACHEVRERYIQKRSALNRSHSLTSLAHTSRRRCSESPPAVAVNLRVPVQCLEHR